MAGITSSALTLRSPLSLMIKINAGVLSLFYFPFAWLAGRHLQVKELVLQTGSVVIQGFMHPLSITPRIWLHVY